MTSLDKSLSPFLEIPQPVTHPRDVCVKQWKGEAYGRHGTNTDQGPQLAPVQWCQSHLSITYLSAMQPAGAQTTELGHVSSEPGTHRVD